MNKNEIKAAWKKLANEKKNTAADMIRYCILKAMWSKSEDKVATARSILHEAFTPVSNANKLANGMRPFHALLPYINNAKMYTQLFGHNTSDLITDEEAVEYETIYKAIVGDPGKMLKHYSYFFTRQDISREQQLVQTAHAALELGNKLTAEGVNNLHFTCIGVANLEELERAEEALRPNQYVTFVEPDIGYEKTCIAVYPIPEHLRGNLRNYKLLSFTE